MSEEKNISLRVSLDYLPTVNLAQHVNSVKVVSQMQVMNCGEGDLSDLHITVTGNRLGEYQSHIDNLQAGMTLTLTDVELRPDAEFLLNLTEAMDSELTTEVAKDGEVLDRQSFPLRLLPYDQWAGGNTLPELLAAYVVPNAPALSQITRLSANYLEAWTGDGSLDGYQSLDRNRARMQVAALYETLKNENIVYANPPASFETGGQRIRMTDRVLGEKLGTCLDLTLLMASLIESVGLYPIVVMLRGHALVGAWLTSEVYTHKVGDDESFLLKESADGNNNIVLVETTALTKGKKISFDEAVDLALRTVREPGAFQYFIDVHRCRLDHVKPLPQLTKRDGQMLMEPAEIKVGEVSQEGVSQLSHYSLHLEQHTRPITRQEIWERKLLDFSLRNNLINTKAGRRVIPFVSFAIENIENQLQAGEDFRVVPWTGKRVEPGEWGIYDSHLQALQSKDFVTAIIQQNQVVSYLSERELQESLTYLYRSSRTAIEENGANSLFLVLGMLKWYENPKSTVPRFAPILLLPIEILRKGGVYSYVLRMRDEGVLLNITLVELLKQQFKINLDFLNPLPLDESGVDVKLVFTGVRRAIAHMQGWDVMEESLLGLFSFNKFVMWNDIHNNADKLKENDIVSSLIDNKLKWTADTATVDPREIDRSSSPADYAIPLDADSSQMEAIVESGSGRSFILHGPPGTGKSQTITNMIANALYQGKRVLFVAEKMAALSVVQSRLEKIGLSPFCLELHSNKVTKTHFLSQMKKALETVHISNPENYAQASEALHQQRIKLIDNMEAMHERHRCGLSLHDIINRYLSVDEKELPVGQDVAIGVQPEDFVWWQQEEAQLSAICRLIGQPKEHPLRGLEPKDNSNDTLESLRKYLEDYQHQFAVFAKSRDAAYAKWKLPCVSRTGFLWLADVAGVIRTLPELNKRLMDLAINESEQSVMAEYVAKGIRRDSIKAALLQRFSELIFQEDGLQLQARWQEIGQKWFLPRFFARRSFLKDLRRYGPLQQTEVDGVLDQLIEYQKLVKEVAVKAPAAQSYFNTFAQPEAERWSEIGQLLAGLPKLWTYLKQYAAASGQDNSDVLSTFTSMTDCQWILFRDTTVGLLDSLLAQFSLLDGIYDNICKLSELTLSSPDIYSELSNRADIWLDNYSLMREWYQWVAKKRELQPTCLSLITGRIEHEGDTVEAAFRAFLKGVYHRLAVNIIDSNDQLRMFNGLLFEKVIAEYRQQTANFQELTKQELYCRMVSRVPTTLDAAIATSELGILKRNIMNGGRGNSIRSIIDSIPTLLPKLCPCMLMSPISVAQYVDVAREKFDLVIFDEASQMPTSEAVGAVARGKALVVVGDPKQMPPTSFFSTSQVDEDEVDIDDMESILDDCIALSVPSHYLTWHYRSRHESLIAFSNSNYYANSLLTFPSVDDGTSKVHLVPVKGVYDKGHSRSNRVEAQAIVDEVIRRLKDPELSRLSIGVVSFSKVQQNLIEDLLSEQLSTYPELEEKAYNSAEPIFIKNLENVQGDERDVILFSVGYGPDRQGRVSMNFGPLNNVGGERRLNVAVSRSRYEMYVFSSLRSEHIDLRRSNALGVIGLKSFLEYAERGGRMVAPTTAEQPEEQVVVNQLADRLHADGYTTRTQVGRSKFKVDLAVADRHNPNRYVLGVLLDGRSYYSTKTTRDREIVQPSILASLGWTVMRLWTLDWYENPDRAYQRVVEMLHAAEQSTAELKANSLAAVPEFTFDADDLQADDTASAAQMTAEAAPYDKLDLVEMPILQRNKVLLRNVAAAIVEHEQPVTRSFLVRRLTEVAQGKTVALTKAIDSVLGECHKEQPASTLPEYYFTDAATAEAYTSFRKSANRDISDIPAIELINALRWVLSQNGSAPRADLFRATALLMGFPRRTPRITAALDAALGVILADNTAQANDEMIMLNNPDMV